MVSDVKKTWRDVLRLFYRPPKQVQVAALCYRGEGKKRKVLLVTSRDTGRWIVPKGWLIDGLDARGSAVQEAWEEAGVKPGKVSKTAIGTFDYDKRLPSGLPVPVEAQVYAIEVDRIANSYPEASERTRKWVSPQEAAGLVREPGLQELLREV